jgi:hypothetical protein
MVAEKMTAYERAQTLATAMREEQVAVLVSEGASADLINQSGTCYRGLPLPIFLNTVGLANYSP